uniref:TauD/TfdA family dioxygenase n=1 Tax=Cupriavidus necator TaxID=106590 RepID=UPI003F4964A4
MSNAAKPYHHPSAWRGSDMARRDDWIVKLDDSDVAELERALRAARAAGIGIPELDRDHFPVPQVARKMEHVRAMLEDGIGFALVQGLRGERYSKPDAALIYWIVGMQIGRPFAQNAQGDMVGHVRDLGVDYHANTKTRGYQTRLHLPFHADSTDIVALMCLRKAKSGGASRIVSSTALHNEMLTRRPDLWAELCRPFCLDRRGEENPGQNPWYVSPCFQQFEGRLFVRYNRTYTEQAQRFPEVPRLTPRQLEAFDMMDALCNDPMFYLDMEFEPGDMQFLSNYTILHSRSAYEDWAEPDRKRHLLRLWLRTPGFARLPPSYSDRDADMIAWQRNPRPPVFDVSEIKAELNH